MSYTDAEQVRHHLIVPYRIQDRVTDQPVVLGESGPTVFYGGAVEADSVQVKSVHNSRPVRVDIGLAQATTVVAAAPLLHESIVVASDSSLGSIYQENVDYVVDCSAGLLTLKDGGSLVPGQKVTVWYIAYSLYTSGVDYSLDADRGEISRLPSGSIAAGEVVRLDYRPIYVSVAEEVIANAVAMANGMVEREVDPEGQFEVDPILGAVATYRALEIICRTAAGRELSAQRGGAAIAATWIKLADDYSGRSDLMLRSFRPPYNGPRNPVRS